MVGEFHPYLLSTFSSKTHFKNSWTNASQKFTAYKNGRSSHSLISVFKILTIFFIVLLGLSLPKEADDLFASVFLSSSRSAFLKYIWDAILLFWVKSPRSSQGVVRKRPVYSDSPIIQNLSALGSYALGYIHMSFLACINECLSDIDKSLGIVFFARQKHLTDTLQVTLKI